MTEVRYRILRVDPTTPNQRVVLARDLSAEQMENNLSAMRVDTTAWYIAEEETSKAGSVDVTIRVSFTNADNEDLNGFYAEARERYTTWTTTLVDRLKEYGTAKGEIEDHERNMDAIAARWVDEGLLTHCQNDRERSAAMTTKKYEDPEYDSIRELKDSVKKNLMSVIEPGLEEAKYLRRLAEEDCRWATASLMALAGVVEAGKHEQR